MKAMVRAVEYVDRSLPTASWWDRYRLVPGEYPVVPLTVNHGPVPEGARPYYLNVYVPAVLVESYRENRLFSAVSAERRHPYEPAVVTFCAYGYQADELLTRPAADRTVEYADGEPAEQRPAGGGYDAWPVVSSVEHARAVWSTHAERLDETAPGWHLDDPSGMAPELAGRAAVRLAAQQRAQDAAGRWLVGTR